MSTFGEFTFQETESFQCIIESSTIHWKIENFRSIERPVGEPISSPAFQIEHSCSKKSTWSLALCPNGTDEDTKEFLGIYLIHWSKFPMSISFSIAILDDKGGEVFKFSLGPEFLFKTEQNAGSGKLFLKSKIFDPQSGALTDDALLISCTITPNNVALKDISKYDDKNDNVTDYFERLLESGDFSDVTFEIGDKQVRLHKAIVASLSPVFFATFQSQMSQKEGSVVQITDTRYEIMKKLFRYIYVRKVDIDENIAGDLLVAADRYDVQGLKKLCESILLQNLNVENALQRFALAVKYKATILKENVVEFIMYNAEEFVGKHEFQQLDRICKDELKRAIRIAMSQVEKSTQTSE